MEPHRKYLAAPTRARTILPGRRCPAQSARHLPGAISEGGDARDRLRASDPAAVDVGETRQLTLNLKPGGNCFVVCGGAPCPAIVQAEFVQERCRSARSKEVSPIFFHSRVLTPSRWSL